MILIYVCYKYFEINKRQCPFCRQDGSSKGLGRKEVNKTKR